MQGAAVSGCAPSYACRGSQRAGPQRSCHWLPPRRRLVVSVHAGLLDLLRGGGTGSTSTFETDGEGEALKQWMTDRGLPQQKLAAASIPGSGRGLVSTQSISKGETLLRIPAQLLLTPVAAQQQLALRPLLVEQPPLPAWSVLALWLAEARAAGPLGEWWPYIRLLPERTGCVLEWTDEEVGWLKGSQLYEVAAEIRGAAEASWAELQPLLAAAAEHGVGPPPGTFSRQALWWAFGVLLSRLVRLSSSSSSGGSGRLDQEALVPFADLLNHCASAACFLEWSATESAVVLQPDRGYHAGQQVLISYGQKTGGELLLSYGFCPANNPHDGCKLMLGLCPGEPAHAWKAAALARHGFSTTQLFPLRMAASPYELVHYAGMAAAAVGSQAEAEQLAARLFEAGDFPPNLQPAALDLVVKACQAALKGYPRSLETDRAELERLQAAQAGEGGTARRAAMHGSSISGPTPQQKPARGSEAGRQQQQEEQQLQRRRMQVLQVLVYERQVLNRTVFVLQQELKDLKRRARQ